MTTVKKIRLIEEVLYKARRQELGPGRDTDHG